MPVSVIEFGELRNQLEMTRSSLLDYMSPEMGRVYVVAVTRDLCSACERQKPQLNELAEKTAKKHNGKVIFTRIHVRYHENSKEESRLSKDILGHYFYPTNLILIRTPDRGSITLYRNVAPSMEELGGNIERALDIVAEFGKRG